MIETQEQKAQAEMMQNAEQQAWQLIKTICELPVIAGEKQGLLKPKDEKFGISPNYLQLTQTFAGAFLQEALAQEDPAQALQRYQMSLYANLATRKLLLMLPENKAKPWAEAELLKANSDYEEAEKFAGNPFAAIQNDIMKLEVGFLLQKYTVPGFFNRDKSKLDYQTRGMLVELTNFSILHMTPMTQNQGELLANLLKNTQDPFEQRIIQGIIHKDALQRMGIYFMQAQMARQQPNYN